METYYIRLIYFIFGLEKNNSILKSTINVNSLSSLRLPQVQFLN